MAFCPSCGSTVTADDRFCGACGNTIELASPETETTLTVNVPDWLASDWGPASKWAGAALLIGIIGHFVVLALLFLALNVITSFDLGFVDWGSFFQIPVQVMMSMHGAVEGGSASVTGIAWILGALFLAYRAIETDSFSSLQGGNPWALSAVRAAKVAVVYAAAVAVVTIVFDPEPVVYAELLPSGGFGWNTAAGFFTTLLLVFVGAAGTLLVKKRRSQSATDELPLWGAGLRGTFRILLIGVLGTIAFFLLAGLLILIGDADEFFAQVIGTLLLLVVTALAWVGLDVGLLLMAEAMRFFSNDGATAAGNQIFGTGDAESWFLIATGIVAVAFVAGGYRAARLTESRELSRLVQAAAIAGGGVVATYVVAAIVIGSEVESISAGIGLSILWTLAAVGGALIYAQSVGALQTVKVNVQRSGSDAPAAAACPSCGAPHTPGHKFCASCGHQIGH